MATGVFARGMSSKTALVIMRSSDAPSRVLDAIQNGAAGCTRIVLAQLAPSGMEGCHWRSPWQPVERPTLPLDFDSEREQAHRSSAWAEILRSVLLIGSANVVELPGLTRQLEVERVVLPSPQTAEFVWRTLGTDRCEVRVDLPFWVINPNIALDHKSSKTVRKILFPLSLQSGFEGRLHLACRLARSYDATLSILHVFPESETTPGQERSPLLVQDRLPLRSLRLSGLLCPMEVCIRSGDPAEAILRFQEKDAHDLIFMRGPRHFNSGRGPTANISHRIMSEAHCPVILVRDSPFALEQPCRLAPAKRAADCRRGEDRTHFELVN